MTFLAAIFKCLSGTLQWYFLWLFHPKFIIGVSGIVFDGQKRVLLLRHRFWREGSWGLPSGYMNPRETLAQALSREVREETGLEVEVANLIRIVSGYRLRLEASFLADLRGGELKLNKKEILEARFFQIAQLPPGLLQSHKHLISIASEFKGKNRAISSLEVS